MDRPLARSPRGDAPGIVLCKIVGNTRRVQMKAIERKASEAS